MSSKGDVYKDALSVAAKYSQKWLDSIAIRDMNPKTNADEIKAGLGLELPDGNVIGSILRLGGWPELFLQHWGQIGSLVLGIRTVHLALRPRQLRRSKRLLQNCYWKFSAYPRLPTLGFQPVERWRTSLD